MTRRLSGRTYRTEGAFKREIERRLRATVPDRLWTDTGQGVWRDADVERGYAVQSELDFALRSFRQRRSRGEMPPPVIVSKEPRDWHLWRLRSLVLARQAEATAREWRERHLAPQHHAFVDAERGSIGLAEFASWLSSLVLTKEGSFLAKPLVRGGPRPRVNRDSPLLLSFPSPELPRFLEDIQVPTAWWCGTEYSDKELIEIDARHPSGTWLALEANASGSDILRSIPKVARQLPAKWSLAQATGFLLFGAVPMLSPLQGRVLIYWRQSEFAADITLSIDSRISPQEVAVFYRDVIRSNEFRVRPSVRVKGFSERVTMLVDFALLRSDPFERWNWSKLWREWERQYGRTRGWSYSSPDDLARVVTRALSKLNKEFGLPLR